jgi:hypothetical protein
MPKPEPIRDDESGAYKVLDLDGLLIVPATNLVKFDVGIPVRRKQLA